MLLMKTSYLDDFLSIWRAKNFGAFRAFGDVLKTEGRSKKGGRKKEQGGSCPFDIKFM